MKFFAEFNDEVVKKLKSGAVGVFPTDTLYGLVASARNEGAIERIYKIKNRDTAKPLIVLVASLMQVEELGVKLDSVTRERAMHYWPGPVSIIFESSAPEYLTRGMGNLAFRWPNDQGLVDLITKTGPLVAPSANPEGEKPAANIKEAVKYFKEGVDFYVDGGEIDREPSRLIKLTDEGIIDLR